jgi:menaquinone-dependent protoporphyrinogen IX oxidase
MKGIILYKGKYGATRQYANWIAESMQWQLFTPEQLLNETLNTADVVVIGSSVYTGRLTLHSWLRKHAHQLLYKKVFLFIVCATPADKKEVLDEIAQHNIPALLKDKISVFFLPGRVVIKDLNWIHKLMLSFASRATKDPAEKQRMTEGFDSVKKENLLPLLQVLNNCRTQTAGKAAGKEVLEIKNE